MATLVVDAPDYSAIKQKALDDAKIMQASIGKECAEAGKDPPPYVFLELIGKGSFGRVYKAMGTGTKPGQLVAIKVISIDEGDSLYPGAADTFGDILKEINALKLLSKTGAKNINTIIDALLVGQSMWMVTEYCAGGSVSSLMRPTGGLPEKWIIPILREVAEAIYWVHKQGIIHRDIKCANVLVTDTGDVQLCDFGVAGIIETKFDKRSTVTGTLQWMAPELFDSAVSYGIEVDIWAFGSMAYEVASGLPPNATTLANIPNFSDYLKHNCPRLEGGQYSPQLKDFVSHCMVVDPSQRPTIDIVQKHPYIFNTGDHYPTTSLSKLVNAYKLWEMQGGSRRSLFSGGGAQGPTDDHSQAPNEEWNFDTMNLDQFTTDNADAEAIYDAYCPRISIPSPASRSRRGRRRPANIKAPTVPLEKAFDPNTLSNYKDDVRAFYGRQYPPSTSDLPLRDDSSHLTLRESLIDLDASLNGSDLSQFADVETIKARPQTLSSDVADLDRRRTQDWTFPAIAPTPTSLEMAPAQFKGDDAPMTYSTRLYFTDDPATTYSTGQIAPSTPSGRDSILSLIDLDAGLPSFIEDPARPSTAGSDSASASSDTKDTPFDLEPMTIRGPSANREPSIYVSDNAYLQYAPGNPQSNLHPSSAGQNHDSSMLRAALELNTESGVVSEPPLPNPPSQNVMQGIGSRDEVKYELRRMISSLSNHLDFTANFLKTLPMHQAENYPTEKTSS
ncbi:kinase-like protein [Xylaria sp. FL1042]|nr:kinase-like protein [Xylaria sp. FL1042]